MSAASTKSVASARLSAVGGQATRARRPFVTMVQPRRPHDRCRLAPRATCLTTYPSSSEI
jgi:hypothetical protein